MHELFDEWSLYSRILANDYMRHAAVSAVVQNALAGRPQPVRVLDLGCGDGWMGRACFKGSRVSFYLGIDTSADALDRLERRAEIGLAHGEARVQLRCEDIRTAMIGLPDHEFDVVLASYCLHHFSQQEKQNILREIRRVLDPGGVFLWIDVVRYPGQSLEQHHSAFEFDIREQWKALNPKEIEETVGHIRTSDFPEEEPWMVTTAARCGLRLERTFFRDDFYGCWEFVPFIAEAHGIA